MTTVQSPTLRATLEALLQDRRCLLEIVLDNLQHAAQLDSQDRAPTGLLRAHKHEQSAARFRQQIADLELLLEALPAAGPNPGEDAVRATDPEEGT